jgi:glycine/D-amino acid oxidase-like deaminating enzyme
MCAPSVLYAAGLNARSDDGGIVALTTVATLFKMVQEFKSSEVRIPEPQLHDAAKIVTCRLGHDRFRVAETAAFNGYNLDIRADRIQPLVRWCQKSFRHMSTATVIPWAGLRPMTPSMLSSARQAPRHLLQHGTCPSGLDIVRSHASIISGDTRFRATSLDCASLATGHLCSVRDMR